MLAGDAYSYLGSRLDLARHLELSTLRYLSVLEINFNKNFLSFFSFLIKKQQSWPRPLFSQIGLYSNVLPCDFALQ